MVGKSETTRVGILGGGQLSRMMAEAARELGLDVRVWAESAQVPVAGAGFPVTVGSFSDRDCLAAFLSDCEVVAFENEFVDCDRLAEAAGGRSAIFRPSLDTIRQWQDKLGQKTILERLGIPTAPYERLPRLGDESAAAWQRALSEWLDSIFAGEGCVLKWARFGYDGKGVFFWNPRAPDRSLAEAAAFCREGLAKGAEIFAESRVSFVHEVAIVAVAGGSDDAFAAYPLVISEQRAGVCHRVRGPAERFGVSPEIAGLAREYAARLAADGGIRGSFAMEFFLLPDGRLWVNELAPRVHNTGHFTLNAARTSQFENHWRGLLGWTLGDTSSDPAFAMLNLLGPADVSRSAIGVQLPSPPVGSHLYWYGKTEIRPGRKLGHVNASATGTETFGKVERNLSEYEVRWQSALSESTPKGTR